MALLVLIVLSAAQSSAQTRNQGAILIIDASNNTSYNQNHWLYRMPYLSIKASNGSDTCHKSTHFFQMFLASPH